ncbi:MAG: exodeoxyribonuclease III [Pseudomonadota bacterium]
MTFKLATWNINSVRLRIGIVEAFLKKHQPDILCLQEIKCQNDQFPSKNFTKLGYEHIEVHGQKGYHGVATVSKRPLVDATSTDYCQMGDTRHLCTGFTAGGKKIRLHNFYVPAGGDEADPVKNPKFDHKLKFLDEMLGMKSVDGGVDQILVGDLNIAPHENDVWSHKQLLKVVSHTPIETEFLDRIRDEGSWCDLVRHKIPYDEVLYSWWSYRARDWDTSDRGRRLDHIWGSSELADHLKSIEILREARGWEKPSDHVPVIAEFNFD